MPEFLSWYGRHSTNKRWFDIQTQGRRSPPLLLNIEIRKQTTDEHGNVFPPFGGSVAFVVDTGAPAMLMPLDKLSLFYDEAEFVEREETLPRKNGSTSVKTLKLPKDCSYAPLNMSLANREPIGGVVLPLEISFTLGTESFTFQENVNFSDSTHNPLLGRSFFERCGLILWNRPDERRFGLFELPPAR